MYITLIHNDAGAPKPARVTINNDFFFQPPSGCKYAPLAWEEDLQGVLKFPSLPAFGLDGLPAVVVIRNRNCELHINRLGNHNGDLRENKQMMLDLLREQKLKGIQVLREDRQICSLWGFCELDIQTVVSKEDLEAFHVKEKKIYRGLGYVVTERAIYSMDQGPYSAVTHSPELEEILRSVRPVGQSSAAPKKHAPPPSPEQAKRRAEKELENRMDSFRSKAFDVVRQNQLETNAEGVRCVVQNLLETMQKELRQHQTDMQAELDRTSMFAFSRKSELRAAIQKDAGQISKLGEVLQGLKNLKTNPAALLAYMIAHPDASFNFIQHRPGLVSKEIIEFSSRTRFMEFAEQLQGVGLCESPFDAPFKFDKRLQYTWQEIGEHKQEEEELRLLYTSMGGSGGVAPDQMRTELLETFVKDLHATRLSAKA